MPRTTSLLPFALGTLLVLGACSLSPDLPATPPALADMEEPLDLRGEPDDETARQALPPGSFSGLEVADARETLADKLAEPGTLRIAGIVENSPAAAAGLTVDDLLLEAQVGDAAPRPLNRPSEWRQIELTTAPGTRIALVVDRAGREARTELVLVQRLRAAARTPAERWREETRVGVVLRTATEVEARAAGLGPGGGAVVVGLAAASPWRPAGLRFGDLLVALDGAPIAHPQDVLTNLRTATGDAVRIAFVRDGEQREVTAALTQRAGQLREVTIPLLFSYEADRGHTETSLLLGLIHYHSTAAAWRFRLLWLIGFGGGDADRLLEVGP